MHACGTNKIIQNNIGNIQTKVYLIKHNNAGNTHSEQYRKGLISYLIPLL